MFGRRKSDPTRPQAMSLKKDSNSKAGGCLLIAFFSIFFFAGVAVGYFLFLGPFMDFMTSDTWVEAPCAVVSSRVVENRGEDGTTYRPEIVYKYDYLGKPYESKRYDFFEVSSSGRRSKQKIVDAHPPGKKTVCYVDPTDPSTSVLNRDFSWSFLFILLPLVFILVGGGGMYWGFVALVKSPTATEADITEWKPDEIKAAQLGADSPVPLAEHSGPVELKPETTALGKVGCSLFVALFWNGITSIFVFKVYSDWAAGRSPWFETIFMLPFVAVGLGLIGAVFYYIMASFNPKPIMRISDATIPLGTTAELEWRFAGNTGSIQKMTIDLIGRESATYRRGTDTITDTEDFYQETLFEAFDAFDMQEGRVDVSIPTDTIHSFEGGNNSITWHLEVKGDIALWPDVNQSFSIFVLPHERYEEHTA